MENDPGLLPWREGRSRSLPVHPTQLYSAACVLALCLVLNLFYRFRRRDGEVFLLFGMLYPFARFNLEMIRADSYPHILGMTDPQLAGIILFAVCGALFLRSRLLARRSA